MLGRIFGEKYRCQLHTNTNIVSHHVNPTITYLLTYHHDKTSKNIQMSKRHKMSSFSCSTTIGLFGQATICDTGNISVCAMGMSMSMSMSTVNLHSAMSWSISIALNTLVSREKSSLQITPKATTAVRWITEMDPQTLPLPAPLQQKLQQNVLS